MITENDCHAGPSGVASQAEPCSEVVSAMSSVSLIELLTELARGKWLIAKVTGFAMLAGVIAAILLPVKYTAVTKLMSPQQTPSAASMLMSQLANSGTGSLAAMAGGGLGLKNPNDVYVGLLKSRPIADALIQKFGLAKSYRAKDMTAARMKLADNTDVASEKEGFISVSVTDRDRNRSAEIANAYIEQRKCWNGHIVKIASYVAWRMEEIDCATPAALTAIPDSG